MQSSTVGFRVNEEYLRFLSYIGFTMVIVVGIVLTRAFGNVDMEATLLKRMYGYNNVCVYFDFPPATFVLPLLWAAELLLFVAFLKASELRYRADEAAGRITSRLRRSLSRMKGFEIVCTVFFSLIFAVKYETHSAREERGLMILHTIPFFFLQMALCSLAVSATVHGRASGYWTLCGMPALVQRLTTVYCAALVAICAYKISYCMYCWTQFPVLDGATYQLNGTTKVVNASALAANELPSGLTAFSGVVDQLFLLFALVLPFAKTTWLLYYSEGGRTVAGMHVRIEAADSTCVTVTKVEVSTLHQ